jgi:hypothetical protein
MADYQYGIKNQVNSAFNIYEYYNFLDFSIFGDIVEK